MKHHGDSNKSHGPGSTGLERRPEGNVRDRARAQRDLSTPDRLIRNSFRDGKDRRHFYTLGNRVLADAAKVAAE